LAATRVSSKPSIYLAREETQTLSGASGNCVALISARRLSAVACDILKTQQLLASLLCINAALFSAVGIAAGVWRRLRAW